MITVYGEGRGFRVVWLLEEMGLPYRLHQVDLLSDAVDPAFRAVNPAGFIPALREGDVTMVESIAIMEYLLARHGPSPLMPKGDPARAACLQFLHLAEAGMMVWLYIAAVTPPDARDNPTARRAMWHFDNRLALVRARLESSPWLAGADFTAADIAMAYTLHYALRQGLHPLGPAARAFLDRAMDRPAHARALAACPASRADHEAFARTVAARGALPG